MSARGAAPSPSGAAFGLAVQSVIAGAIDAGAIGPDEHGCSVREIDGGLLEFSVAGRVFATLPRAVLLDIARDIAEGWN